MGNNLWAATQPLRNKWSIFTTVGLFNFRTSASPLCIRPPFLRVKISITTSPLKIRTLLYLPCFVCLLLKRPMPPSWLREPTYASDAVNDAAYWEESLERLAKRHAEHALSLRRHSRANLRRQAASLVAVMCLLLFAWNGTRRTTRTVLVAEPAWLVNWSQFPQHNVEPSWELLEELRTARSELAYAEAFAVDAHS